MAYIGKVMNKSQMKTPKGEDGKLSKGKSRIYYSAPNLAHQHYYPRHDCGVNHDTRTQFKATPMPHYPSTDSIATSSLHRKHIQKPQSYTQPSSREDISRSEESMLRPYWLDLKDGGNTFHQSKPFYPPGPQSWSEWERIKRIKEAREAYKSPRSRDQIVREGGPKLRRLSLESERRAKPKKVAVVKNSLRNTKVYSKSLPKINQIAVDKKRKEPRSAVSTKQHTQTEITLLDMQRMFPLDYDEYDQMDGTISHLSGKYIPAHEICYSELVFPVPDKPPGLFETGTTLNDILSINSGTNVRTYISQRHDTVGGYHSNWSSSYLQTADMSRDDHLNDSVTYSGNVQHISKLENMPQSVRSNTKEVTGKSHAPMEKEVGLWLHKDIHYQEETTLPTKVSHSRNPSPKQQELDLGLKRVTIEVSTMKEYHNPRLMNSNLLRESNTRRNQVAISSVFYPMRKDYELKNTSGLIDILPENPSEAMLLTPLVEKASGFYVEETHSRAGIVQLCTPSGNMNSSSRNKNDRRPRSVILFDEKELLAGRQSNLGNESSRNSSSLNKRHTRAPDVVPRDADEVGTKPLTNKTSTRKPTNNKTQTFPSKVNVSTGNAVEGKVKELSSKKTKTINAGKRESFHLHAKTKEQLNETWNKICDPYEKDTTDMTLSTDTTKMDSSMKLTSDGSGILNGFDSWSRYDQLIYIPVEGPMEL